MKEMKSKIPLTLVSLIPCFVGPVRLFISQENENKTC